MLVDMILKKFYGKLVFLEIFNKTFFNQKSLLGTARKIFIIHFLCVIHPHNFPCVQHSYYDLLKLYIFVQLVSLMIEVYRKLLHWWDVTYYRWYRVVLTSNCSRYKRYKWGTPTSSIFVPLRHKFKWRTRLDEFAMHAVYVHSTTSQH